MDPTFEILSAFKLHDCMGFAVDHGGRWSFRVSGFRGMKCFAIVSGECWLDVESSPEPVHLQSGDCFLLPNGASFIMASDLTIPALAVESLIAIPSVGGVRIWNGGGHCSVLSARFNFSGSQAQTLLEDLPAVIHIRSEADRASLRWYLRQMVQELDEPRLGGAIIVQALASSLLAQALRLHLEGKSNSCVGCLRAMADAQLKLAVRSMHQNPSQSWTLQELAHESGMSRSAFARRFKTVVGVSAMEYLMRWKMLLAGDRLLTTGEAVDQIALSLGYESEESFRLAFCKVMGCPPKQYRRIQREVA